MLEEVKLPKEFQPFAKVQEAEEENLLEKANVVGIGIGHKEVAGKMTNEPCLSFFVSQKLDASLLKKTDNIPRTVQKCKTDVIETGEIFADLLNDGSSDGNSFEEQVLTDIDEQDLEVQLQRQKMRPVVGGFSVGHFRITAGTIAIPVIDRQPYPTIPRRYYILSNNHVLANSNAARIGDPILQPGRADGGRVARDRIGRLSRFVPIRFGGTARNFVDAAIAEVEPEQVDRRIHWIGYPKDVASVRVGTIVQKSGRTTNYTTGRVTAVNATIRVNYGGQVALFVRQILTTNMSAPGDSGSLVCDLDCNVIGLLFAGSSRVTVLNPFGFVQSLLNIRLR